MDSSPSHHISRHSPPPARLPRGRAWRFFQPPNHHPHRGRLREGGAGEGAQTPVTLELRAVELLSSGKDPTRGLLAAAKAPGEAAGDTQ